MANIRTRADGKLFLDFYYKGVRCREYTKLKDTPTNRRKLERALKAIMDAIDRGDFDYSKTFPNSKRASKFAAQENTSTNNEGNLMNSDEDTNHDPKLSTFAETWLNQQSMGFKESYRKKVNSILQKHLLPAFGEKSVSDITKADILNYRASLAKVTRGNGKTLSHDRINQVINLLQQILHEAADQYQCSTITGIKQLRVEKNPVYPFTFAEITLFLNTVPSEWHDYYAVAFFTGMRTSEINGLQWDGVNFERREIHVYQSLVDGTMGTPKTMGSHRYIAMSPPVYEALQRQYAVSKNFSQQYVFCNRYGGAVNYRNLARRVWTPTLQKAGLKARKPYQTRHTAATLWLASGESVEWIAHQLGHSNAKMLLTVYSRFVPNAVRQDGKAFEQLLLQHGLINKENNNEK